MTENNTSYKLHSLGIPIAHALLWLIGILVTTDLLDVLGKWFDKDTQLIVSVATVIIIFFGEIVFSFIDVVLDKKIRYLNANFLYYIAILILAIILMVILMFLGHYFLPNSETRLIGKFLIGILILDSTFVKGMEIWLQNNWNHYAVDNIYINKRNNLGYTALD